VKRWILKYPAIASSVLWVTSAITLLYGFGHIASAFGVEFDAIPAARPLMHLFVGASLLISSLTGRIVYLRLKRRIDRRRIGDRQSMARAIWERAEQNYLDESRARGR